MAKDCLQKSQEKVITSRYFYELSENLEKLLTEVRTQLFYNLEGWDSKVLCATGKLKDRCIGIDEKMIRTTTLFR